MNVADVREKWNRRYREKLEQGSTPEPNPLALRFRHLVRGGGLLDAACGLGTGIAALLDRVDWAIGVDLSDTALRAAQTHWSGNGNISWIRGDVARLAWPDDTFSVVTAFGFTDRDFLRRVPAMLREGGLICYQGFSQKQRSVKPGLDPAWTITPEEIASFFPGWRVLAIEESEGPPWRVGFAALR